MSDAVGKPGDELLWDGDAWVILDPDYLGDGVLLERLADGEERVVSGADWEEALDEGAIERLDGSGDLPGDEHPYWCPACGARSHLDVGTVTEGEQVVVDCSVCCRPMQVQWDGDRLHVEPMP
jgi:hypothetical protein